MNTGKKRTSNQLSGSADSSYIYSDISLSEGGHFDRVHCPVCGSEYNRVGGTGFLDGKDNYETRTGYRGDAVITNMYCEDGHSWQLVIAFHKGISDIFARYKLPARI
ncbi:hypothetical protein [Nostoc sp. UHCC 0870]|uniref:hypothetical protein n=1 Tax=Nostoc sp. UHCC 0870 TaxID=2914041 RepID=UPI001EE0D94A|nr:hypothetical protein [Nostoc sp. UHCC 0870]UKP01607.1 hypothetical protein L6494_30745 [Nostoc sp. UHCC 0870]